MTFQHPGSVAVSTVYETCFEYRGLLWGMDYVQACRPLQGVSWDSGVVTCICHVIIV